MFESLRKLTHKNFTTRVLTFNPAIAKECLENSAGNRTISLTKVRHYRDLMESHRWHLNNDAICFDMHGRLINGHHRLRALEGLPANVEVNFLVAYNLEDNAKDTIDVGRHRSNSDILKMSYQIEDVVNVSSACKIVKMLHNCDSKTVATMIPEEQVNMYANDQEAFVYVNEELAPNKVRSLGPAPVRGALVFAYKKYPEFVKDFIKKYKTGAEMKERSGPLHLRNFIFGTTRSSRGAVKRATPMTVAIKTLWCLRAHVENKDYRNIGGPTSDDKIKELVSFFE